MITEKLLSLLDSVRPCGSGKWQARCPAHDDRHPSLSIREGDRGVLVKCWVGCTVQEITAALGITVRDLFYDAELDVRARRAPQPRPWRFNWRRTTADIQSFAEELWLRATSVLDAAQSLNPSPWSDNELDIALDAVGQAYEDLERAESLEITACGLRLRGIKEEQTSYGRQRRAA